MGGRLLGQYSRQGEAALDKVQEILCTDTPSSSTSAFPLVIDFLKTHPRFYKKMSEKMFARFCYYGYSSKQFNDDLIKYCTDFMNLGLEHFLESKLEVDDLLAFFRTIAVDRRTVGDMLLVKC